MLLYVHVPFCRAKCHYCGFHSVVPQPGAMETYVDALRLEMALWSDRLGRPIVNTVYIGGGTPSLLPPKALTALGDGLRRAFAFAEDVEFTVEGNPESLGAMDTLQALKDVGVTRLSMGVQSVRPADLTMLGRAHTHRQTLVALEQARLLGFNEISLDLMFGLPDTRLKQWLDVLRNAAELGPQHLSCYGLTVEPDTPLERACLERRLALPSEDEQAKMFIYGADYLEERGYLQYEISNFARLGYQSRHNLGYWEGKPYLGLGPSAVSTMGGARWTNPADLRAYATAVRERTLGDGAETLSPQDRLKEMLMLRLRTTRGLNLRGYRLLTGEALLHRHRALVEALSRKDLIRIKDGYMRLTRNGMLVSNAILTHLFAQEDAAVAPSLRSSLADDVASDTGAAALAPPPAAGESA